MMRRSSNVRTSVPTSARKSVLIVDRDESTLHLCSYLALQNGLHLSSCSDVGEAFRILANLKVDLVVTNLDFPTLTGIDLVHHVRTSYPDTQVVVMIPLGDVSSVAKAIRGGATDYLMKPFSADEFQRQLRDWIEGRGLFSRWARSQTGGLPEARTFRENTEIWMDARKESLNHQGEIISKRTRRVHPHAAIVADAVRTLHQIIQRDIEETAMFAYIDEAELLAAYHATYRAGGGAAPRASLCEAESPSRENPERPD